MANLRKPNPETAIEPHIAEAIMNSADSTHVAAVVGKGTGGSHDLRWMSETFAALIGADSCSESFSAEVMHNPLLEAALEAHRRLEPVRARVASFSDTDVPVEVSTAASPSHSGFWAAIVADLRSDEQIDAATKHSDQRFESLVDSLAESVWVVREGRLVYANASALALLRADRTELRGKPFLELVHERDQSQVHQWLIRFFNVSMCPHSNVALANEAVHHS